MSQLRTNLEAAARGYAAEHGADRPNLFAEALAELKRLDAIEADVRELFNISMPAHDRQWDYTTAGEVKRRIDTGRRLGVAVGAHGFVPTLKVVNA